MLTKNLLRYRAYKGRIKPRFLDPADPDFLGVAGRLIEVFEESVGRTRAELSEACALVTSGHPETIVVRGLEKLLLDRTIFDTSPDVSLQRFRAEVFSRTGRWLSEENFDDTEAYRRRVGEAFELPPSELSSRLYADLPEFQEIQSFKSLSPERLLHRYNAAQVQGLLMKSHALSIEIPAATPEKLRQLFKHLRFHQLLATIRRVGEGFAIEVDGPLDLFYKTRKYGLQLALFFPALLEQPHWRLRAQIELRSGKCYDLRLDETCGLRPYTHRFHAYVPEEIRLFERAFTEEVEGWRIEGEGIFIPFPGEFYAFPDYTFRHESGVTVSMELFHPWHSGQLRVRLAFLERHPEVPLIVGVARVLLKDAGVAEAIEGSPIFAQRGFLFREMPTLSQVRPLLERFVGMEVSSPTGRSR